MSEYDFTPTTDLVRKRYSMQKPYRDRLRAEFDRWLDAHDDQIRAEYEARRAPAPVVIKNIDGQTALEWWDAQVRAEAEQDERVVAWERVVKHPVFAPCYDEERPLLESMLERLSCLVDIEAERTLPSEEELARLLGWLQKVETETYGQYDRRRARAVRDIFATAPTVEQVRQEERQRIVALSAAVDRIGSRDSYFPPGHE